jgi:hypothetical protein
MLELQTIAVLQGRRGPASVDPEKSRNGTSAAGQLRSNSNSRIRGCSNSRHAGTSRAAVAASAPHALRETAAKMGFGLVPINSMHGSASERLNVANVSHQPKEDGLLHSAWDEQRACSQQAEWPSANARWSPGECIFRSSKTQHNVHAQHAHQIHGTAAHRHHSEAFQDIRMQIHPYKHGNKDLSPDISFSGMARIVETPASTPDDASQHSQRASERQGARAAGFGIDRNCVHRYSQHSGGASIVHRFGGFEGDEELADNTVEQAERLQLRTLEEEAGALTDLFSPASDPDVSARSR